MHQSSCFVWWFLKNKIQAFLRCNLEGLKKAIFFHHLPISGFLASRASSVLKRVLGKQMKILDLQGEDLMTRTFPSPLLSPLQQLLTFPVCTPPACSPGGWPESRRRPRGCRASLAKCPDRGAYTWDWMSICFLLTRDIRQTKLNTFIQTVKLPETGGATSAGRLQSVVCRQSRLSGPSGFPWGPGTSPGVWPELHQMCLQGESLFVCFFISLRKSSFSKTYLAAWTHWVWCSERTTAL